MKDYSSDIYMDESKFILSYEKDDEFIVVNYADGTKDAIPTNDVSEQYILDAMEKQATKAFSKKEELEKCKKENLYWFSLQTFILLINLFNGNIPSFFTSGATGIVLGSIVTILLSGASAYYLNKILKTIFKLKDIEKCELFLENKHFIEEKQKNKNNANNYVENNELTINSIDKMSLKELKEELEKIKRSLEFQKVIENVEEKDKTLTLKRNQR